VPPLRWRHVAAISPSPSSIFFPSRANGGTPDRNCRFETNTRSILRVSLNARFDYERRVSCSDSPISRYEADKALPEKFAKIGNKLRVYRPRKLISCFFRKGFVRARKERSLLLRFIAQFDAASSSSDRAESTRGGFFKSAEAFSVFKLKLLPGDISCNVCESLRLHRIISATWATFFFSWNVKGAQCAPRQRPPCMHLLLEVRLPAPSVQCFENTVTNRTKDHERIATWSNLKGPFEMGKEKSDELIFNTMLL